MSGIDELRVGAAIDATEAMAELRVELAAARKVVNAARNVQVPLLKDDSAPYPIPSWGYDLNAALASYDATLKRLKDV